MWKKSGWIPSWLQLDASVAVRSRDLETSVARQNYCSIRDSFVPNGVDFCLQASTIIFSSSFVLEKIIVDFRARIVNDSQYN